MTTFQVTLNVAGVADDTLIEMLKHTLQHLQTEDESLDLGAEAIEVKVVKTLEDRNAELVKSLHDWILSLPDDGSPYRLPGGTHYTIADPRRVLNADTIQAYKLLTKFAHTAEYVGIHGVSIWGCPMSGTFEDQNGTQYSSTDVIAVIPVELVEDPHNEFDGVLIYADENGLEVSFTNGVIQVGPVIINTNPPEVDPGNGHDLPGEDHFFGDKK